MVGLECVYTIDIEKGQLIAKTNSDAASEFEIVFEVSRKDHNGWKIQRNIMSINKIDMPRKSLSSVVQNQWLV